MLTNCRVRRQVCFQEIRLGVQLNEGWVHVCPSKCLILLFAQCLCFSTCQSSAKGWKESLVQSRPKTAKLRTNRGWTFLAIIKNVSEWGCPVWISCCAVLKTGNSPRKRKVLSSVERETPQTRRLRPQLYLFFRLFIQSDAILQEFVHLQRNGIPTRLPMVVPLWLQPMTLHHALR